MKRFLLIICIAVASIFALRANGASSPGVPKLTLTSVDADNISDKFEWELTLKQETEDEYIYHFECENGRIVDAGTRMWVVVNGDTDEWKTLGVREWENPCILDVEIDIFHSPEASPFSFTEGWYGEMFVVIEKNNTSRGRAYFTNDDTPLSHPLPIIKEGRIWEYAGPYFDSASPGTYGEVRHFMKFEGTTEISGKVYSDFVLFKSDFYKSSNEGTTSVYDHTDLRTGPRFYMREENGSTFVLAKDNFIYYTLDKVSPEWFASDEGSSDYNDFTIYNLNLAEGDAVSVILDGYVEQTSDLIVNWCDNIQSGGVSRRVMQYVFSDDPEMAALADGYIVEGIGITSNGHLACYDSFRNTAIFNDNSFMPGQQSMLVSVCEPDGTCIYGQTNAIETVSHEPIFDSQIYDVMGRRVKETVSGSVYIRDGRKFVAK